MGISSEKKLIIAAVMLAFLLAFASGVKFEKGTEFVLVDQNNSSIILGQNYSFTNTTVYGDAVEFKNSSVANNISVYPDSNQNINSTLEKYKLNDPIQGEVFKIETEANSPVTVTYEVDAKSLSSGSYELYNDSSELVNTFSADQGTLSWTEDQWSNNTFSIEYTGNVVELNWSVNSDNENGFNIYSNASGSFPDTPEVEAGSAPNGERQTATHSSDDVSGGSLNSGETIAYKVRAYNEYGESNAATGEITIP